ncbi:MAG: hypothetical protein SGPRY_000798 [Prymnesium sp.]
MKRSRLSTDMRPSAWWHMDEGEWYAAVLEHWCKHVSSEDDDGVLGGYGEIDERDATASLAFARSWNHTHDGYNGFARGSVALDCGAGIGRVSKRVLLHLCERVELVEVSQPLLAQAEKNLSDIPSHRLIFTQGSLPTFSPSEEAYDIVWMQWVLGHLTDSDVIGLLSRCRRALKEGGVLVVKDNNAPPAMCIATKGRYILDEENAAVIRSYRRG